MEPEDPITARLTRSAPWLFLLTYAIALACLLDYQSLWLDEVIQLLGTRSGTLGHTEQLTRIAGEVPLGWLPQLFAIHLFGFSAAIARLPSTIAAVASCVTVFFTARKLGLRYPLAPAIVLGVLPLHFRYALEARPYAEGMLATALATLVFLRLIERQSIPWFVAYAGTLMLGVYTQPLTCLIGCAHFVWAMARARRQLRLAFLCGGALVFMVLAFLPWYRYAAPLWNQAIQSTDLHADLTWKTPLMLIREITGAGYTGGILLLVLAAVGVHKASTRAGAKWLLVACSAIPVIGVFVIDAFFSYFFAIRQLIFVLPPLALLAADGLSALMRAEPRKVAGGTALLAIIFICADIGWLQRPREDWGLAARALARLSREHSACTLYAPPNSLPYYSLFEPRLENSVCPSGSLADRPVALAISPYTTAAQRGSALELLKGKRVVTTETVGMSTIQVYR